VARGESPLPPQAPSHSSEANRNNRLIDIYAVCYVVINGRLRKDEIHSHALPDNFHVLELMTPALLNQKIPV
jgi:hypothetical protein